MLLDNSRRGGGRGGGKVVIDNPLLTGGWLWWICGEKRGPENLLSVDSPGVKWEMEFLVGGGGYQSNVARA